MHSSLSISRVNVALTTESHQVENEENGILYDYTDGGMSGREPNFAASDIITILDLAIYFWMIYINTTMKSHYVTR